MKKRILVPYCIISSIVICIAVLVGITEEKQMEADSFAESELTFAFNLNGYRRGDKLIGLQLYAAEGVQQVHQFKFHNNERI